MTLQEYIEVHDSAVAVRFREEAALRILLEFMKMGPENLYLSTTQIRDAVRAADLLVLCLAGEKIDDWEPPSGG